MSWSTAVKDHSNVIVVIADLPIRRGPSVFMEGKKEKNKSIYKCCDVGNICSVAKFTTVTPLPLFHYSLYINFQSQLSI